MNKESKENYKVNSKTKSFDIEFFTPKSNLSIESLNRNIAFNNLFNYVNRNITNYNSNKKTHLKDTEHYEKKSYYNLENEEYKEKEQSKLSYLKESKKIKEKNLRNIDTEKINKKSSYISKDSFREINKKTSNTKRNKYSKKRTFSECTSILKFFNNFETSQKEKYSNNLYNSDKNSYSEITTYNKKVRSEHYEKKIPNEEKFKLEYTYKRNDYEKYNDYLEIIYLYCKKYFLSEKMEFFSNYLFYREGILKNFIFLIDSLFLKKKYVELLNLLKKYRNLWIFSYNRKQYIKKNNFYKSKKIKKKNKLNNNNCLWRDNNNYYNNDNSDILNIGITKEDSYRNLIKKNVTKTNYNYRKKEKYYKCKNERTKMENVNREILHDKKRKVNIMNKKKFLRKEHTKYANKTCNKIYCISYLAFVKILSLLKMKNQKCLNKCLHFISRIDKKILLNKNANYLMQIIIKLYELNGLYNYSLRYSILLFLKYPIYPHIILKLFSFSILCLKDEIHLILLATYPKKMIWLKYFLYFILYSVNHQFQNKRNFDNVLFLIENVKKKKKKYIRSYVYDEYTNEDGRKLEKIISMKNNKSTKKIKKKDKAFKKKIEEEYNEAKKNLQENEEGYLGISKILNCSYDYFFERKKKNSSICIYKKIFLYNSIYNKVSLYDAYIYITKNKFSNYFPKFFLFSKLHIIINIKRSFYEKNYTMCYSLSKLLLNDHIYESTVITFFVNSSYLLNKISCIKKLADELKKNKKYIFFLFSNAALLLHFKQVERAIQIYKYIIDSYENIFSDLYFFSLFNLIYALELTQKAHQIVILCKNMNKLFFNNIHSYILLSYYYYVNDIPLKSYYSLIKAYNIYHYHPDIYYILSLLALRVKKFKEYVAFSELALFFSLKKKIIRNYIFTYIYKNQQNCIPNYLLYYNFKIMNNNEMIKNITFNIDRCLCYFYFENLIKSYVTFNFCSYKRKNLNYLILGENLCNIALNFFYNDLKFLHFLRYIEKIKKNEKHVKLSLKNVP
ncbi:conserved Plasmodium protein, unknown function [Plasmodium relictum]|uniref:Uncharacterized protein n=1 Tax=Plasmodium relictum TaxID=85471 RepID=A0A1J1HAW9_PLARL|nr:conserved Plasmodium protein, unknown function [Plasmodium relictum]CRH02547.1 conserved Plasmodium protein, unknown function [Plasmodium relictum]